MYNMESDADVNTEKARETEQTNRRIIEIPVYVYNIIRVILTIKI